MAKTILCLSTFICLQLFRQIKGENVTEDMNMSTMLTKIFDGYDKKLSPNYNKENDTPQYAMYYLVRLADHLCFVPFVKPVNFLAFYIMIDASLSNEVDERAVEVTSNIFIISMFSISEIDMDFSLSMFLRMRWKDERLVYDDVLNLTRLELETSLIDSIWVPDLFIITEKFSDFHEVTVPNKLVHIYPDGTVQYSARVTGSFFCVMDLRRYPFDTQTCKMEFESYGQTTKNLHFKWSDVPLTMGKGIKFPQFDLVNTETYNCDKEYYGSMSELAFPCIGLKFILERNYAYHMIQIYVPSILIVILSWVNFWLDCTSVPGRVSLALLTVLTMTTQSSGARSNLPRVSYIKAIDVWMAACLTFVFLGLLEFAYVNVQSRVLNRRKSVIQFMMHQNGGKSSSNRDNDASNSDIYNEYPDSDGSKCTPCFKTLKGLERARAIDKVSRVVFPCAFVIFNLIYWIYYFSWTEDHEL